MAFAVEFCKKDKYLGIILLVQESFKEKQTRRGFITKSTVLNF